MDEERRAKANAAANEKDLRRIATELEAKTIEAVFALRRAADIIGGKRTK